MKKLTSPLKLKDCLTLIGLIIIGFGWLLIDQIFLPEVYQRVIAFFVLMLILYYLQFSINKPTHLIQYANSVAIVTVFVIIIVSVVMHVIITNDFTYKSVLVWLITGVSPYVAGFIYIKTKKK
ncbi:MAG: hypothetical protein ABR974_01035 [Bacteroidales bacterium]|jgi:hypothetical protein